MLRACAFLNLQYQPVPSLTDDVVQGGVIGAREEVGEEVDHHETVLLALKWETIIN